MLPQGGLPLIMLMKMTLSAWSSYFRLPSAGITGMCHRAQRNHIFPILFAVCDSFWYLIVLSLLSFKVLIILSLVLLGENAQQDSLGIHLLVLRKLSLQPSISKKVSWPNLIFSKHNPLIWKLSFRIFLYFMSMYINSSTKHHWLMPGIKSNRWLSKPHSVECSQSGICGFEALAKISCCFNGVSSYSKAWETGNTSSNKMAFL